MNNLPKNFALYLKNQSASPTTTKNYLSDFNHFWGWLILTLKGKSTPFNQAAPTTIVAQITPAIINDYKKFLLVNKVPDKTINRRLSTLRKFGKFCISQGWLKANPATEVDNVSLAKTERKKLKAEQVLSRFKEHLEKEKVSSTTTKNYLCDLRHFFVWLNTPGVLEEVT